MFIFHHVIGLLTGHEILTQLDNVLTSVRAQKVVWFDNYQSHAVTMHFCFGHLSVQTGICMLEDIRRLALN